MASPTNKVWSSVVWHVELLAMGLLLVAGLAAPGGAIDCFRCDSLDGSRRDCEDEFGPLNKTGHLIARGCRVGVLNFTAHYCVKIKGIKENGQHIIIRDCAMEDWGTQCGDLLIEQPYGTDQITGCLATCDFDGCNSASHWFSRYHVSVLLSFTSFPLLLRNFFTSQARLLT